MAARLAAYNLRLENTHREGESMKQFAYGAAAAAMLALTVPGHAQTETQAPAPVQPGAPPAAQTHAPPPTPYVVPTTRPVVKKSVRRRTQRARARRSSDNIANQLNAQELAGGHGVAPPFHGAPGYGAP